MYTPSYVLIPVSYTHLQRTCHGQQNTESTGMFESYLAEFKWWEHNSYNDLVQQILTTAAQYSSSE